MNELTKLIEVWAENRNLTTADPAKQIIKLGEEYGELCEAFNKGNRDALIDSIGDIYVVITILSKQLGLTVEECVSAAYSEIKNRTGSTINGVFVKSSDLKG